MSKRVIIGTAPNLELGKMYEQMLRDAGVPVAVVPAQAGSMYSPAMPPEIWLEDEELLNDPDIAATIQAVLNPRVDERALPEEPVLEEE